MPQFPGRAFNPKRSKQLMARAHGESAADEKAEHAPAKKKSPAKKGKPKGKGKMPFPPQAMQLAAAMRSAPFKKK